MVEKSRFWNGTTLGDASEAPYDAPTELAHVLMSALGYSFDRGRILKPVAPYNWLAVTSPGANTVRVDTGEALVAGSWYQNDANVDVNIPTPGGATRIDRIVLRKSWASQTIRVTRIAGAEGGGAPSLTQVYGTTWDFPLVQVSITTGGAITITDGRRGINRSLSITLVVDLDDATAKDDGSLNRGVFKFNDAATKYAFGMASVPHTIIPGTPITYRARWFMQSATSGNVRLDGGVELIPVAGAPVSSVVIPATTFSVPGTAGHIKEMEYTITTLSPATTDWFNVRAGRLGGDGADTAVGDLNMIATVELEYESYA